MIPFHPALTPFIASHVSLLWEGSILSLTGGGRRHPGQLAARGHDVMAVLR